MKLYLTNDAFKNKTMFFLDAHVDNSNIHHYKKRCPLFEELEAIKKIERKDNVILIDDLRIIRNAFPWGETSYGHIDFLKQIIELILTINPDYKFATLDGHIADDVLIAYVF
jgi:archaellum biogenesis ATPase FlaH